MRTCISFDMVCDGVNDCLDHSDEIECNEVRRIRNRSKKDESSKTPNLSGLLTTHTYTYSMCSNIHLIPFYYRIKIQNFYFVFLHFQLNKSIFVAHRYLKRFQYFLVIFAFLLGQIFFLIRIWIFFFWQINSKFFRIKCVFLWTKLFCFYSFPAKIRKRFRGNSILVICKYYFCVVFCLISFFFRVYILFLFCIIMFFFCLWIYWIFFLPKMVRKLNKNQII